VVQAQAVAEHAPQTLDGIVQHRVSVSQRRPGISRICRIVAL
jgi:hypothetical protein